MKSKENLNNERNLILIKFYFLGHKNYLDL